MRTVLGCALRSSTSSKRISRPACFASARLSRSRRSSVAMSISPPTIARSVPWPRQVLANDPWNPTSADSTGSTRASATSSPSSRLATRPMRAAPAVCELDGPIITGPRMLNSCISCSNARFLPADSFRT